MTTPLSVRHQGLLTLLIERDGDALVLRAVGEIDIATAKALDEELRRALSCDASPIVLDLGKVEFLDSIGLQVLLLGAERSRQNGNRLRIRNESAAVRKVIAVSGVEPALPLGA
jgi:anti-sigma B factor antagonist